MGRTRTRQSLCSTRATARLDAFPNPDVAIVAALFAAIFALRVAAPHPEDATLVLCVVPIVLCAIRRGVTGGIVSALAGIALTAAWEITTAADVGLLGYTSRSVAFVVVGVIVGRYAVGQRSLEQRLERSYEVAVDLQCVAGFDGYFKHVNPAGCALLGYTEEELLARPFVDLVHPDDREHTAREASALAGPEGPTIDFENRYRIADGTYRWLAWRSVAADGFIYAGARDITAQKTTAAGLEALVAERTRDLHAARFEDLRRLAHAAEYRDDDTHRHTERVGTLALKLAQRLGASRALTSLIEHAAPLHDVGKLGVPDAILLKPGRLTDDERAVMQNHTTMGADILSGSTFPVLRLAEEIALTHHERWDGTGYPSQLSGDDIPLSGRIVAVADVFDALAHARPYKPAWPVEDAVAEIIRCAGTQFDPDVVRAFEDLHREGAVRPTGGRLFGRATTAA